MSIQSPAKCEIRSVIRYLVWKGKTPVEVYNEVKTAYGDKGMYRTSVLKWCREFKNGRTSVYDDQRSGRPSILTDDIVEKIENALRDDRRLTVDELSAMFPQISRSLLHETIVETLGYRKLSARWVPKQLTDQHKLNRVEAGQEFLRRYKLHGDEFLRSIVTGDETWVENLKARTRLIGRIKRLHVVEGFHQETQMIRKLLSGPIQHDYYGWGVSRVRLKEENCCVEYVSRAMLGTRELEKKERKKEKADDTRAALPVIFPAFDASSSQSPAVKRRYLASSNEKFARQNENALVERKVFRRTRQNGANTRCGRSTTFEF
ncbi:SETMR methyltransferase, partial [Pseudoatta argentina]